MKKGWTLKIDDDYPGKMLRYRCHLWDPEGKFRGENYVATKLGAKFWGWREVQVQTRRHYQKRTEVKL